MTKDRPRNRPGKGQKQGHSGGGDRSGGERAGAGPGGFRDAPRTSRDGFRTQRQTKPWRDPKQGEARQADERDDKAPWKGQPRERPPASKPHRSPQPQRHERKPAAFEDGDQVWIWGLHAASAALRNPRRRITRVLATRNAAQRVGLDPDNLPHGAQLMEAKDIDRALPADAVHQGLAVKAWALDAENIEAFVIQPERPIAILDQVTDPQNVGAVLRSAAAFGIAGVVLQTRNAPALGGYLAKAAAGAVEQVAEIRAVNISRAIEALTQAGWNVVGLDGAATATIDEAFAGARPLAIVMGAEGAGLRPGVAQSCSMLARIPMGEGMESLNVSNAAAIAFYEAARRSAAKPPPKQAATRAPSAVADDEEDS